MDKKRTWTSVMLVCALFLMYMTGYMMAYNEAISDANEQLEEIKQDLNCNNIGGNNYGFIFGNQESGKPINLSYS